MKSKTQSRQPGKRAPRRSEPKECAPVRGVRYLALSPPVQYKIVTLRECPPVKWDCFDNRCRSSGDGFNYWSQIITTDPGFNPDVECMVILLLSVGRKINGHYLISTGTVDSLLVHPREVFRAAVIGAAQSVLLMHNHPSGNPYPSHSDVVATGELLAAAGILKIQIVDHLIIGSGAYYSFRQSGHIRELGDPEPKKALVK
jgi:DNA repair protein RadC